jgi:hypothetical protein
MRALRRRVLGAQATLTWKRLPTRWRLASVAMMIVLLAALVVAGVLLFSSKEWGTKLAGIAAAIAVLYAGYQVSLTRALAKRTLAYEYFERFSRYSLERPYKKAKSFTIPRPSDKAEAQERWDEFKRWETKPEDQQKVSDIMFIFNFFEELGGVYRHGAADRQVIDEYLGKFALAFWKELDWFICRIRKEPNRSPTLFEDWGRMSEAVERALNRKKQLREKDEKRKGDQQQKRQPPHSQRPDTQTAM